MEEKAETLKFEDDFFDGNIAVAVSNFGIQFREDDEAVLTITRPSAIKLRDWLNKVL